MHRSGIKAQSVVSFQQATKAYPGQFKLVGAGSWNSEGQMYVLERGTVGMNGRPGGQLNTRYALQPA
jgi:hypothetical protein